MKYEPILKMDIKTIFKNRYPWYIHVDNTDTFRLKFDLNTSTIFQKNYLYYYIYIYNEKSIRSHLKKDVCCDTNLKHGP